MANQTSTWQAWVDLMPPVNKPRLHVSGEINAPKANYQLVESVPQGINRKILLLEIEPDPVEGGSVHPLKFEKELNTADQYSQVQIKNPAVTIEIKSVH